MYNKYNEVVFKRFSGTLEAKPQEASQYSWTTLNTHSWNSDAMCEDKPHEDGVATHYRKQDQVAPASIAWPSKGAITEYTACISLQTDQPYSRCQLKPYAWPQVTARSTQKIIGKDDEIFESTNFWLSCFIPIKNQEYLQYLLFNKIK